MHCVLCIFLCTFACCDFIQHFDLVSYGLPLLTARQLLQGSVYFTLRTTCTVKIGISSDLTDCSEKVMVMV